MQSSENCLASCTLKSHSSGYNMTTVTIAEAFSPVIVVIIWGRISAAGTTSQQLNGYVPPNGVVFSGTPIYN